ncbi:hypothetical protein Daus18300_010357 [Diaporthe australafricana]|uniref:Transcription factor gsfR2 n=1 Tax=Diaporthe australafricana TaxID=127596 RepID=A0ABR3WAL9_9PEZI
MGNGSISTTPSHDTSTTGDAELENEILRSFGLAISKLPFGSSASPASGPSGSVTTSLGTEESSSPLKNLKWFTHLSTWKIAYHYQPPKELPPPQAFSDYTRGLQSWLRRFQREGHNPFIHRHLYPTRAIPDSIQDAYAAIAVSEGSCPENENMVDHIATSLVTRLLSSQSQVEGQTLHLANTLDHLARTQALLIHLLLALFSPSISRQAKAESLIETLHRWKLALWESASQEANLAELFPYLHTMPLEGERSDVDSIPGLHRAFIMCESVRRTWLVCSMTTGVYRALRGDWTAACGGDVRFTARAGLWDASSPARWAVLAGKADPLFNYSLLGDQLANCEILESDVDEFALHIFALMWGSDKVESWFIQT